MRRKILASLALLLCLCTLFVSCGAAKTMKFTDLVVKDTYTPEFKTPTSATKLSVGGNATGAEGSLVLFTKIGTTGFATYSVYNIEKGSVVFTADAVETKLSDGISITSYEISLKESNDVSWFYVTKNTTTTSADKPTVTTSVVTLYKADGTSVASAESKNTAVYTVDAPKAMCDLIYFNNVFYRTNDEDGNIEKAIEFNGLRKVPYLVYENDDFYYGLFDDTKGITVFDKELNVLVTYTTPDYAEDLATHILADGNIFVQYETVCNDHCEDYTYLDDEGVKYHLTSLIIDAATGKEKELELDFVVRSIQSRDEMVEDGDIAIGEDIENFAIIYYIVDERIDYSDTAATYVSMGNNMKVKAVIDGYIPGNFKSIALVANNRWALYNNEGQCFLLNENGDVLGEITNVDEKNDVAIIADNKIYSWDLEVKCDLNEQGAVDYDVYQNCVVFTTFDGETKVYADGSVKTLISKDDTKRLDTLDDRGFIIVNEKTPSEFTIYNDKAAAVYTSDKSLTYTLGATVVAKTEEAAVVVLPCLKADLSSVTTYIVLK